MGDFSSRAPVASCHSDAAGPAAAAGAPVIALAGAPNVGKTTLFNALTGSHRQTGNWPGTSVAVGHGSWRPGGREVAVVDLPGTYSLDPLSPDEQLTRDLLVEVPPERRPDLTVVVLDATALARGLYLLAQIRERPGRVAAALTMNDIAARHGIVLDLDRLAEAVATPVVAVDPRHGTGLDRLAAAVVAGLDGPAQPPPQELPACCHPVVPAPSPAPDDPDQAPEDLDLAVDDLDLADARFAWIDAAVAAAQQRQGRPRLTHSDRIDRVATSPVGGAVVFLAAMWLVFQTTTAVAAPLQRGLAGLLTGPVTSGVQWLLDLAGLGQAVVARFVIQGLLAGVGMLLTFVPLMALMFGLLAVLEDSGYLARAAVVTDRLMRRLGLPGRAFLPLVVGFGCNVPAVSGTRVLPDARHRLLTTLLVPFTSCSARLTVYVLVAGIFFPEHAGSVVFGLYLVSLLFVVAVGFGLRSTVLRAMPDEPLMIDLPPYHLPVPRLVLRSAWTRLRGFLSTASGLIVGTVALVWLLQAVPVSGDADFGEVPVQDSLYAATARTLSPVFAPAGFGDWRTTSALMTGFVAKEAVISTWAQTYAASQPPPAPGQPQPPSGQQGQAAAPGTPDPAALGTAAREHFTSSSGGHPAAAAWAFLVFLLAYTPCVATLAAQRREIGLRWTAFGVAVQLLTAWLVAALVFQVGRLLT